MLVALGQAFRADAFAQPFDLFLVDDQIGEFVQIDAGLAEGGLVGTGITDEVEQRSAVASWVDAKAHGLGEERLAAFAAMAARLVPLQRGGASEQEARLGVFGQRVATAGGAEAQRGRGRKEKGVGLARQGKIEEGFAEGLGQEQGGVFQGGKGGAPRRAVRAVQAINEIFRQPLKQVAAMVYFLGCF